MYAWEQIQQTIEYIETHLSEDMTIEQLANLAALSPFYYQRLFSRLVKKPVMEYIKLRRLGKATDALLSQKLRILDIALDLGFTSHEHFTRVFKEAFGITPDDYRKNPLLLNKMTKPELLLHYSLVEEGVPLITEGIVLEVNKKTLSDPVIFTGYRKKMPVQFVEGLGMESGADPLGTLWDQLHHSKENNPIFSRYSEELGVAYPCPEEGYFYYFAGARTEKAGMSDEYNCFELPPGEYVVCTFEASDFQALVTDALYKAQNYLYSNWLPRHQLETESFCAERYESHSETTSVMELWLKIL